MRSKPEKDAWRDAGAAVGDQAVTTAPWFAFRTLESMKHPWFRLYWFAMLVQFGAMNMQMVARAWLMYELTDSVAFLGILALTTSVPMLTLSLFGGVIADRVQKKNVLIVGQAASFVLALVIGLVITLGAITWVYLIAYSVVAGTIMALMNPSRNAIIPELVGPERLTNAVALNAAGMNLERLIAPIMAGYLIASLGIAGVYYIMAALYLFAASLLAFLPRTGTITLGGNWAALEDAKEGLLYVRHNREILIVLLVTLVTVLLSMPYMFLLPAIIKEGLGVTDMTESAKMLGTIITVSGIGALAGSLMVASLPDKKRGLLLLASILVLGLSLAVFSFSPWYSLSLIIMVPLGLGQAGRMAISNALAQAYVDDEHRGRVMSIYMLEFGLASFGTFFVGVLARSIGVQWAIGGAALILIGVTLCFLAFAPRLRKLA